MAAVQNIQGNIQLAELLPFTLTSSLPGKEIWRVFKRKGTRRPRVCASDRHQYFMCSKSSCYITYL